MDLGLKFRVRDGFGVGVWVRVRQSGGGKVGPRHRLRAEADF